MGKPDYTEAEARAKALEILADAYERIRSAMSVLGANAVLGADNDGSEVPTDALLGVLALGVATVDKVGRALAGAEVLAEDPALKDALAVKKSAGGMLN